MLCDSPISLQPDTEADMRCLFIAPCPAVPELQRAVEILESACSVAQQQYQHANSFKHWTLQHAWGKHLRHKRRHRLLLRGWPLGGRRAVGHAGRQRPGRVHRVRERGGQLDVQLTGAPLRRRPAPQRLAAGDRTWGWDYGVMSSRAQPLHLMRAAQPPSHRYAGVLCSSARQPGTACHQQNRQALERPSASRPAVLVCTAKYYVACRPFIYGFIARQLLGSEHGRRAHYSAAQMDMAGAHLLAHRRRGHVVPRPRASLAAGTGQRCLQRGQKVRKERVTSAGLATPCRMPTQAPVQHACRLAEPQARSGVIKCHQATDIAGNRLMCNASVGAGVFWSTCRTSQLHSAPPTHTCSP